MTRLPSGYGELFMCDMANYTSWYCFRKVLFVPLLRGPSQEST